MFDESLGGFPSEIVCMIDRVCTTRTIRYPLDEPNSKDDGRFGKIIEEHHLEPGSVHGRCQADMRGLELKTKNINLINVILFLTDYHFYNLQEKKIDNIERVIENKSFVINNINKFIVYNLNQNSLINAINNKLSNG